MSNVKEAQLLKVVENILALNTAMRFASILDLKGNIIEGIMKDRKTSLESQRPVSYTHLTLPTILLV